MRDGEEPQKERAIGQRDGEKEWLRIEHPFLFAFRGQPSYQL